MSPLRRAFGTLLVVLGLGGAAVAWAWSGHLSGDTVARMRLQAGTTEPLTKIVVSTEDSAIVATMGPFPLDPSMNPLRPHVEVERGGDGGVARYVVTVSRTPADTLYEATGHINTLVRSLPGTRSLTLPRFTVSTRGQYHLTLAMTGPGPGSMTGLPRARLELRAQATRVSALWLIGLLALAAFGLAVSRPRLRPLMEAEPQAQLP